MWQCFIQKCWNWLETRDSWCSQWSSRSDCQRRRAKAGRSDSQQHDGDAVGWWTSPRSPTMGRSVYLATWLQQHLQVPCWTKYISNSNLPLPSTGGAGGASLVHSPAYEVTSWTIVADIVLSVSVGNLLIAVDNVSTTNVLSQWPNKLGKMSNL